MDKREKDLKEALMKEVLNLLRYASMNQLKEIQVFIKFYLK